MLVLHTNKLYKKYHSGNVGYPRFNTKMKHLFTKQINSNQINANYPQNEQAICMNKFTDENDRNLKYKINGFYSFGGPISLMGLIQR